MKRALAILVLALVVLSLLPSARADSIYQASWDTTAGFNGGVKTTVDTATDSCLASGQGFQLNATGGNYGVTAQCPAGTPNVPRSIVLESYDGGDSLGSFGSTSVLPSFGLESLPLQRFGTVTVSDGTNGRAQWIGSGAYLKSGYSWRLGQTFNKFTFFASIKTNSSGGCLSNACTLVNDIGQGAAGFVWIYISDNTGTVNLQWGTGVTSVSGTCGVVPLGQWVRFAMRLNYTGGQQMAQCWADGSFIGQQVMTGAIPPTTASWIFWGAYSVGPTFPLMGSLDNFGVLDDWASNPQMVGLTAVGSFVHSGFWSSPNINLTDQYPYAIALGFRNETEFSYVQSLYIFNASDDSELWHTLDISFATGDSNVTYVVLPAGGSWPRGNVSLYLTIGLTGTGNGTAQVIYAAIIFASLPALAIALPSDITTWLALLFLLIPLGLLWLLALYLDRRWLLLPAGIITFLLAFFAWTELSAFGFDTRMAATISLVAVGIVTLFEGIPGED